MQSYAKQWLMIVSLWALNTCGQNISIILRDGSIEISHKQWEELVAESQTIRNMPEEGLEDIDLRAAPINVTTMRFLLGLFSYKALDRFFRVNEDSLLKKEADSSLVRLINAADYLHLEKLLDKLVGVLADRFIDEKYLKKFASMPDYIDQFKLNRNIKHLLVQAIRHSGRFNSVSNRIPVESKILPQKSLVWSVAWSSDGKLLASGSGDHTITIWNVAKGSEIKQLAAHKYDVRSVAWSPDGKLLVIGFRNATVRIWDAETGREIKELPAHIGWVRAVALSPDDTLLASGLNDGTIRIWDVAKGTEIKKLAGHQHFVDSVAWSPDGRLLASGSSDKTIRIWDVAKGSEIKQLACHQHIVSSVALSPDGRLLASGSSDNTIRIWDITKGTEIKKLAGEHGSVRTVAWSPDGKLLASGSHNNSIQIWDMRLIKSILETSSLEQLLAALTLGAKDHLKLSPEEIENLKKIVGE